MLLSERTRGHPSLTPGRTPCPPIPLRDHGSTEGGWHLDSEDGDPREGALLRHPVWRAWGQERSLAQGRRGWHLNSHWDPLKQHPRHQATERQVWGGGGGGWQKKAVAHARGGKGSAEPQGSVGGHREREGLRLLR